MKKTIDEILNRNDYSRLTEQMRQRVEEIAERIHYKLDDLDIANDSNYHNGEICYSDVIVRVARYSCNDDFYTTLTIKSGDVWHTLERVGREAGFDDGNYIRGRATNNECLAFLNVARKLIEGLGYIEEKKAEAIQKALSDTFFLEEEK